MTATGGTDIRFSVCVPALNEERSLRASIEDLIGAFKAAVGSYEIIIVDDGSSDGTASIAESLSAEYGMVKVIHHERPEGIGSCYFDALRAARGEYFSWFPADRENDPNEFLACLPYLSSRRIVTCHHAGYDNRSRTRRALSRAYRNILNLVFGLRVTYYNGLSVYPTQAARTFPGFSRGFFFNAENMILGLRSGLTLKELVFPLSARAAGRSHAVRFKSLMVLLSDSFRFCMYYFREHPGGPRHKPLYEAGNEKE